MRVVETWPQYVRRVAPNLTQAQIAKKMGGISTSNVGRWLRGEPGQPTAENVIAFAKAFHRPPMEALTVAGYFTDEETGADVRSPISQYTTEELLDEVRRRVVEEG